MVEIRNYKHYDAALFCEALNNILVDLEKNPNEEWLSFKDLFLTAADKHAPMIKRRVRGRSACRANVILASECSVFS